MRSCVSVIAKGLTGICCLIMLSGCISFGADQNFNTIAQEIHKPTLEQETLQQLTTDLKQTPWPTPRKKSMATIMLGSEDTSPAENLVLAYIEQLNQETGFDKEATFMSRISLVERDANTQLAIARALNDTARQLTTSPKLSSRDIALVENAIISLRDSRAIFVKTLKELSSTGETISHDDIRTIKAAFVNISRSLGQTADQMAENLSDDTGAEPTRAVAVSTTPTPIPQADFSNFQ